jgi:hypothetical protein
MAETATANAHLSRDKAHLTSALDAAHLNQRYGLLAPPMPPAPLPRYPSITATANAIQDAQAAAHRMHSTAGSNVNVSYRRPASRAGSPGAPPSPRDAAGGDAPAVVSTMEFIHRAQALAARLPPHIAATASTPYRGGAGSPRGSSRTPISDAVYRMHRSSFY